VEVRPRGEHVIFNRNYFRNSRFAIVGDELELTNRRNRSRRFPLARTGAPGAARAVVFAFVWLKGGAWPTMRFPYRKLLVVDAAGNTMASIPAIRKGGYFDDAPGFESAWSREELAHLCAAAGLAYEEKSFADTEELQHAHPGAIKLNRFYTHPRRYVLRGVLITFALIAALAVLAAAVAALAN
jgi:hypothetical protein